MDSFLRSSNILASMLITLLISIFAAPLSAEACLDSSDISIHCGSTPSASFDDNGVLWAARVMQVSAFGLGVLTLLVPTGVNWFVILYALVGFGFSAAYTVFLLQRNPEA